ncbi:putative F-box domain-containing protein [Helianthus anomalus]
MADLPIETIFEILTRVPTKVVGRSRSVCKEWYALLSIRDFIRVHCSRSLVSSNQRVLLIDDLTCFVHPIIFQSYDYGPRSIVTLPFDHQNNDVSILSHLNGLLCVCLNHTNELLLWNPTTTAFKHLSTPDSLGIYINNLDAIGLYADDADDYKVLHIKHRWGQLKEISFPPVPSTGFVQGVLVNVKNELHMFATTGWFEIIIDLWTLKEDYWIKVLSCPPIPPISLSLWGDITIT